MQDSIRSFMEFTKWKEAGCFDRLHHKFSPYFASHEQLHNHKGICRDYVIWCLQVFNVLWINFSRNLFNLFQDFVSNVKSMFLRFFNSGQRWRNFSRTLLILISGLSFFIPHILDFISELSTILILLEFTFFLQLIDSCLPWNCPSLSGTDADTCHCTHDLFRKKTYFYMFVFLPNENLHLQTGVSFISSK